jgi:hypothetical protein
MLPSATMTDLAVQTVSFTMSTVSLVRIVDGKSAALHPKLDEILLAILVHVHR